MADPWEPLTNLETALQRVLDETFGEDGIKFHDWVLFPRLKGCQIVFVVNPQVFLPDDERETLKQFEEMMDAQKIHDLQERAKDQIQRIVESHTGGILDDPPSV